jgi:hypothetical protein
MTARRSANPSRFDRPDTPFKLDFPIQPSGRIEHIATSELRLRLFERMRSGEYARRYKPFDDQMTVVINHRSVSIRVIQWLTTVSESQVATAGQYQIQLASNHIKLIANK